MEYEEWIGNADDYRNLYFSAMALKFVVIIVFCVALFRIKRLVTQLLKYGYVASRRMLYSHIAISFLDLFFSLVIGLTSLDHAHDALLALHKVPREGIDQSVPPPNAYKILSSLNFNQLYQVPNSLMMLVVLFYVLKYMRNHAEDEEMDEDIEA